MSDYGRYGDAAYDDRDRYREDNRRRRSERSSFFSGPREDRGWIGRDDERARRRPDDYDGDGGGNRTGRSTTRDRDARQGSGWDREEGRYGYDDRHKGLPIDETERLIASNKVEGTPVYGREGERLGSIYNFMVDKYSGQVEYAVMGYGGFLGMGQRYYPVPWRILSYDTREGGYRVDMDYRDLERAPSFGRDDEPRFNRDYGRRVHSWYGLDY
jgi:hypothetical protein